MTPDAPVPGPGTLLPHVGFVGLAGAPNVGKSTLVNRLVGQKVSIVSRRPQTTRERVCGIVTDPSMQAILVDIPGVTAPRDALGRFLLDCAAASLKGCDLVIHLRDARRAAAPEDDLVLQTIRDSGKPCWLVWNKIDRLAPGQRPAALPAESPYERALSISAKTGRGVPELLAAVAETLPAGPMLYDPDQISDRHVRFMVAELVREQLFRHLGQEVPYGTAAETEVFDEDRPGGKIFIRVLILTERKAHKPILIGEGGQTLKKIGQQARRQIEELLGEPVFLELWVKIRPHWRADEDQLKRLGLKPPDSC